MPIIASAVKRVRQQSRRRSHNLQVKRALRQDIRKFEDALAQGDSKTTATSFVAAVSELDRAVKKGVLHRNTASRHKSRLQKQVNALIKPVKTAAKPKRATAGATTTRPTRRPAASAKPKAAAKA